MSSRGTDELTPRDARRATRRSLIVQEQRSRRGAILAQRRSAGQTRRQNSRQHQANRNIEKVVRLKHKLNAKGSFVYLSAIQRCCLSVATATSVAIIEVKDVE